MSGAITFAVPFYSNAAYLRRAVESALAQTVADVRVLVLDDCGPEPEAEGVIRGLNDARVTYRRHPANLGLAGNWNACLDAAGGGLVTLLHADDELLPEYAALMLRAAARWPDAAAFFCNARIIGPAGEPVFSLPDAVKALLRPSWRRPFVLRGERGLAALLAGDFIMCPTLCYRVDRLGGRRFDGRWRQVLDLDFKAGLLLDGHDLVGLPEVAYSYRRHAGSQTSQLTASMVRFEEEAALYAELARRCHARGWMTTAAAGQARTMIQLNLGYCLLRDLMAGRAGAAWAKAGVLARLALGLPGDARGRGRAARGGRSPG